jgi:hypothetical protein
MSNIIIQQAASPSGQSPWPIVIADSGDVIHGRPDARYLVGFIKPGEPHNIIVFSREAALDPEMAVGLEPVFTGHNNDMFGVNLMVISARVYTGDINALAEKNAPLVKIVTSVENRDDIGDVHLSEGGRAFITDLLGKAEQVGTAGDSVTEQLTRWGRKASQKMQASGEDWNDEIASFRVIIGEPSGVDFEENHTTAGIERLAKSLYFHVYGDYLTEDDENWDNYIADATMASDLLPHLLNAAERGIA